MVVELNPLSSVAQNVAPARTEKTSTPSGAAAPVARPQQEGAAAPSAPTPQNAKDNAQDEPKEEPRRRSSGPSLADLGGTRLSILQDTVTERFVYRGVNAVTKEVERQFPSDADLARSAFLRKIQGSFVDEQT
jgi:hypothetical protein